MPEKTARRAALAPRTYEFDFLVFIGRFQPFHQGHKAVIDEALKRAKRVIVVVGSAKGPRTLRNPFTFDERIQMIRGSYVDAAALAGDLPPLNRVLITPMLDLPYQDQQWITNIQMSVQGLVVQYHSGAAPPRIGLIGHSKDETSYYLKMFPTWASVAVENFKGLSATDLRGEIFSSGETSLDEPLTGLRWSLPQSTHRVLRNFCNSGDFKALYDESRWIRELRFNRVRADGHPVIEVTVDAVVIQAAHVLLVRRGKPPGKGQLALPGGYLGETERLIDGVLRELKEETRIRIPPKVLLGCFRAERAFDDPHRSARGRIITHAFLFELDEMTLPVVKGADDAASAGWYALASIDMDNLFEDHSAIIRVMTGFLS